MSNLTHDLTEKLSQFVKFHTKGRDPSHGWEHMSQVAHTSLQLYHELPPPQQLAVDVRVLLAVSWLHDISDHTYDPEGKLQGVMREFLVAQYLPANAILTIIEAISFSKEQKLRRENSKYRHLWYEQLGEGGLLVRDLASDADKLEALGAVGYERCVRFIRRCYPQYNQEQVNQAVLEHWIGKLRILAEHYLCTPGGLKRGVSATRELEKLVLAPFYKN